MFLGSAPDQPFDPERYVNWRWFWDFGGGSLTDLFLHWVDVAQWYMASDTPIDAQAMGGKYVIPEFQWPDTVCAAFHYPGNFMVNFDCSLMGYLEGGGLVFHGTKALMRLHRGGFAIYPEQPRYTELARLERCGAGSHIHARWRLSSTCKTSSIASARGTRRMRRRRWVWRRRARGIWGIRRCAADRLCALAAA